MRYTDVVCVTKSSNKPQWKWSQPSTKMHFQPVTSGVVVLWSGVLLIWRWPQPNWRQTVLLWCLWSLRAYVLSEIQCVKVRDHFLNSPWTIRRPEVSQLVTEVAGSWKLALSPPTTERPAWMTVNEPSIQYKATPSSSLEVRPIYPGSWMEVHHPQNSGHRWCQECPQL